jgi:hypothetical protein
LASQKIAYHAIKAPRLVRGGMKENFSLAASCENAAIRVQYWFGKDKENLLQLKNNLAKPQDFYKKYKYDLVKTPRIPTQIKHLPLQGYVLSKKKRNSKQHHVTKETSSKPSRLPIDLAHCCVNQKNLNLFHQANPLTADRVAQCRLKEHFLVSKRLKSLSKEKNLGPRRHQVVRIQSTPQKDMSQNPYLQEWVKIQEERHFQIGRVIKYFTD